MRRVAKDGPQSLPPLETQYADYAAWQESWLQGDELKNQLEYWRARLEGCGCWMSPRIFAARQA